MDVQVLGFKNSLARHFSSIITVSRISLMKHMLRFQLKAMKYGLGIHYSIIKRA
jgi:hypothetical protein